jgi:hypothetical protein
MADPGDATGMTIKEMVKELYSDMKLVRADVGVLCAANLPTRVDALERKRDIGAGRSGAIALVVSGIVTLVGFAMAAVGIVR